MTERFPTSQSRCPRCGGPLLEGNACAPCLLREALAHGGSSEVPSDIASTPLQARGLGFQVPAEIGDYVIRERIGEGAMGVVHRAHKRSLRKDVAIKFMKAGRDASGRQRALFMREAQLASHLDHPHIITVSEVGERDGSLFLVMRLVEGRPLSEKLLEPGFCPTVRSRVELLLSIVRAVHFAHQRGVIHRDLKPGNILVDVAGQPAVGDFGLARWLTHDSTVTVGEGAVIGTPAFMPPEHAGMDRDDPTMAGDVWSLGVILYLMLSGRLPFEAPSIGATVHKILNDHPAGPFRAAARGGGSVPQAGDLMRLPGPAREDLESVCLRCLEKKPGARYASAGELAEELQRWLNGEPVTARPAGAVEVALRWVARRPALTSIVVLGLVALGGLVLGVWQRQVNLRTERLRRVFNYVADMNLAQRGLRESNAVLFERAMAAAVPAPGAEDFRGIEWSLMRRAATAVFQPAWYDAGEALYGIAHASREGSVAVISSNHVVLLDPEGKVRDRWNVRASEASAAVAIHPDATLVVAGTREGVRLFRPGQAAGTSLGEGRVTRLALSPDGTHLAVACRPGVTNDDVVLDAYQVSNGQRLGRLKMDARGMHWMPSGRLRFSNNRSEISEWDLSSTNAQRLQPFGYLSPTTLFVQGGSALVRNSRYGALHRIDIQSGQTTTLGHGYFGEGALLACNEGGEVIAGSAIGGLVRVLTPGPATNPPLAMLVPPGHAAPLTGMALSQNGKVLFTSSLDGTVRRTLLPPKPEPVHDTLGHRLLIGNGIGATFSPDGRWIALLESRTYRMSQDDESTMIWDTREHRMACRIPAEVMGWGPDSRHLLSWDLDGRLRVWDLQEPSSPREVSTFRLNRNQHWQMDTKLAGHDRWLVSISNDGSLQAYDVARDRIQILRSDEIPPRERFPGPAHAGAGLEATPQDSRNLVLFTMLDSAPHAPAVAANLGDGRVVVWRLDENRVIPIVRSTDPVIQISGDGRYLALMGPADSGVSLYDAQSGAKVASLQGHESNLRWLAFSGDGRQLITGGSDHLLIVWNLETRREVYRETFQLPIAWIRVAEDGRALVTTHLPLFFAEEGRPREGVHHIWSLDPPRGDGTPAVRLPGPGSIWERYDEVARRYPPTGTNVPSAHR